MITVAMVNHPVSILRREPRARILRHAHSHHRSLSAVSSALANVTPPGSPDRTCSTEEEEAHVEEVPAGLPDVASQIPGLFEESGCAVVAHRGLGMNLKPGRGIRENTVASIIAAHDFGAAADPRVIGGSAQDDIGGPFAVEAHPVDIDAAGCPCVDQIAPGARRGRLRGPVGRRIDFARGDLRNPQIIRCSSQHAPRAIRFTRRLRCTRHGCSE